LEDRLRSDLPFEQALSALEGATDEIVAACFGWQLTPTESTIDLQGSGSSTLLLPRPPVTAVLSVVDEAGDEVTGWTLRTTVVDGQRQDRLESDQSGWDRDAVYTVNYEHGFDDATRPAVLKEISLRLACRMWINPEQVMQKRRGDYSASFGSSAVEASGLTKWEMRLLANAGLRRSTR
jgi:hypothetical protein